MRLRFVLISAFVLIVATLFAGCGNNQPDNTKTTDVSDVKVADISASTEAMADSEAVLEGTTSVLTSETETIANSASETETPSDITAEETQVYTTEEVSETLAEVIFGEPQINFSELE